MKDKLKEYGLKLHENDSPDRLLMGRGSYYGI